MFASEFDYCGSHSLRSRISIMGEDLPTYIRRWNIVERFAERLEVEETYTGILFYYPNVTKCYLIGNYRGCGSRWEPLWNRCYQMVTDPMLP